jgi:hypothetical protein
VNSVEVDLKAKAVTVAMKKGSLTREAVVKALAGTKFKVSSFAMVEKKPAAKKAAKPVVKTKKL